MNTYKPSSALLIVLGLVCLRTPQLARAASPPYEDLANVVEVMQSVAATSGNDASADTLKDGTNVEIHTGGLNAPNTPIWRLLIAKQNAPTIRNILVTGTHHAREWVAYRAVLDAAQFILINKDKGQSDWANFPNSDRFSEFTLFKEMNLKALTDNARICFVPIVNPEGYYFSKEIAHDPVPDTPGQPGWRKNRRDVSAYIQGPNLPGENQVNDQSLENPWNLPLEGVDLNRNYPAADWGTVTFDPPSSSAWQDQTTSRWRWFPQYCGKPYGNTWDAPFWPPVLENETRAIEVLSGANNFDCHIDVHSTKGTVGWVANADANDENASLRSHGGLSDRKVLQILGAKAAEQIIDPDLGGPYEPEGTPYATSGDTLVWQYEQSGGTCLPFLIEIGKAGQFRPANATLHADAVLPGQLFMMFAAVDKSFSSKPTAKFRKP